MAIVGEIAGDCSEFYDHGIDAVLSIAPGTISLRQAMARSEELVTDATERALRLILIDPDKQRKAKYVTEGKPSRKTGN